MGFLGSLISEAIKKVAGDTLGKAVEEIVKPMINQAQQQSETIDTVSKSQERDSRPVNLSRYIKICPECHEGCSGDNAYCPSCGAAIGAGALEAAYTCPGCDHVNELGSTHCVKCGRQLPAEDVRDKRISDSDEDVLSEFIRVLPQYPVWRGGRDFTLEVNGERDGHPVYVFTVEGGAYLLEDYIIKLKAAGFRGLNSDDSDLYYKVIDGLTYCFSCTDAITTGGLWVGFYVDHTVSSQNSETRTATPTPDITDLAKDIFRRFNR